MKEKSPKVEQLTIFVEATSPAEAERLALIEAKRQKPGISGSAITSIWFSMRRFSRPRPC